MAWGARNGVPGAAIFTASGWWLISSLMFLFVKQSDVDPKHMKTLKNAKSDAKSDTPQ